MNIRDLERNPQKVHEALFETESGQLVAKKQCRIYIPARWADRKLAKIANEIRIMAIFALVVEDKYYTVYTINSMAQVTPTSTALLKVSGDETYQFTFEPGAVIMPNMNLVKNDIITYYIYDEIIAKGNVPWYMSYSDLGKLFATSAKHAGISLGSSNIPIELIVASISRQSKDRTKYYRHLITSIKEELENPPAFIPFRSIIYGPTNTTAKLMGAYFEEGILSSLNNPATKREGVEDLLRS